MMVCRKRLATALATVLITSLTTGLLTCLALLPGADARAAPIPVYLDTKEIIFDVYPLVTEEGRVLVGMRGVFEAFGSDVHWNGDLQKITASNGDTQLEFAVNSSTYWIDGAAHESDTAPRIVSNRVLVPLRLIAECYQAKAYWNGDMQAVFIFSRDYQPKTDAADESENNNSLKTAVRLYPGQEMKGTFGSYNDVDYFRLWIHQDGTYAVTIEGGASDQEPSFEVYDIHENRLAASLKNSQGIPSATLDLPIGYYYIKVANLNDRVNTIQYTLLAEPGR